jgi:hypothetical protein
LTGDTRRRCASPHASMRHVLAARAPLRYRRQRRARDTEPLDVSPRGWRARTAAQRRALAGPMSGRDSHSRTSHATRRGALSPADGRSTATGRTGHVSRSRGRLSGRGARRGCTTCAVQSARRACACYFLLCNRARLYFWLKGVSEKTATGGANGLCRALARERLWDIPSDYSAMGPDLLRRLAMNGSHSALPLTNDHADHRGTPGLDIVARSSIKT